MSQAPAMPLFCDAYLADTMHLSNEESGCYMKLLMVTWRNNGKPLPDDDKRLARTLSISEAKWRDRIRPRLVEFFDLSEGAWRQKRLEKEWNYCEKIREEASRKGKLGGRPKSLKDQETDKAPALTELKLNESPLTHTHSSKEEEKPTAKAVVKKLGTRLPAGFVVPEDWIEKADAARVKAGLPQADLRTEGVKYANYWTAKTGQAATKLDWLATWINWALSAKGNSNGRRASAADGIAEGFASALAKRAADRGADCDPAEPLRLGGHAPGATGWTGQ